MKNWFRRRNRGDDVAHALYLTAVEQARRPVFYAQYGVPDSLDGRFDLIVLHVYLLLQPLNSLSQPTNNASDANRAGDIAQSLFDTLFGDMDRSLREMGVSDISVGKRVKQMAKAFYGRVAAYNDGLAGTDEVLADALRRNLFGTVEPEESNIGEMAQYLRLQAAHLAEFPADTVLSGNLKFAPWP